MIDARDEIALAFQSNDKSLLIFSFIFDGPPAIINSVWTDRVKGVLPSCGLVAQWLACTEWIKRNLIQIFRSKLFEIFGIAIFFQMIKPKRQLDYQSVSYTHLTLPTKRIV